MIDNGEVLLDAELNKAGFTYLHLACFAVKPAVVKQLLVSGASPMRLSVEGKSPLHMVAEHVSGDNAEQAFQILTMCSVAGGDLFLADKQGATPETVSLKHGMNINDKDPYQLDKASLRAIKMGAKRWQLRVKQEKKKAEEEAAAAATGGGGDATAAAAAAAGDAAGAGVMTGAGDAAAAAAAAKPADGGAQAVSDAFAQLKVIMDKGIVDEAAAVALFKDETVSGSALLKPDRSVDKATKSSVLHECARRSAPPALSRWAAM
jgi:hypothetical protein